MSTLRELFPDPQPFLELEPDEAAGFVLEHLHLVSKNDDSKLNRNNFVSSVVKAYYTDHMPDSLNDEIHQAILEAWLWLESEGLLAPKGEGWYFISRRGDRLKEHTDVEEFQKRNLLPRKLLHPVIAQKTWSLFLRADYETAVFVAFKEVEVAVRDVGGFAKPDIGVPLMRKAFHEETGPLTDKSELAGTSEPREPIPERQALAHLFAGAIGRFKNPASHRHGSVTAPEEAVEMLMIASHLMRIVDERRDENS